MALEKIPYPNIKILLVEDNLGDARLIQELLNEVIDFKHDLISTSSLSEGLQYIEKESFDVILLDLSLPDSNGFDTIFRTREKAKNMPIVVLTGLNDENFARKAVQAGAQDYLIKGQIESNPLVRSIYHAIDRNKMMQTIESLALTLEKSESQLKEIINTNADSIIIVDKDGIVRFVNPAAEEFFRRKNSKFIGEYFGFPTTGSDKTEIEIVRETGEISCAEMRVVEFEWEKSKAHLLSIRDISEHKQFLQCLKESEEKYRDLFENSPYPIIILNLDGVIIDVNSSLEYLTGYSKNEIIKKSYKKSLLFSTNYLPLIDKAYNSLLKGDAPEPIEIKFNKKNKEVIWLNLNFSLMKLSNDTLIHILIQNITEIKQSKQELKELERSLQEIDALIESAPLAIFLIYQDGKILRANEVAINFFEYTKDELLNLYVFDLFEKSNLKRAKKYYNEIIYDLSKSNKIEISTKKKREESSM